MHGINKRDYEMTRTAIKAAFIIKNVFNKGITI